MDPLEAALRQHLITAIEANEAIQQYHNPAAACRALNLDPALLAYDRKESPMPFPRRRRAQDQDPDDNGNNDIEGAGALADFVDHRLCALEDAGEGGTHALAVRLIDSVLKNHRAGLNGNGGDGNGDQSGMEPMTPGGNFIRGDTYGQPGGAGRLRSGGDYRGKLATVGELRRTVRGAQDHALAMDAALQTARGCGASEAQLEKVGSPAGAYRVALRALGHPRPDSIHSEALPHVLAQWRYMPAMDRAAVSGKNRSFAKRFPGTTKINASGGSPWR
jgi:hypothetical protein